MKEELRDEVAGVLITKLVNVTNLPEWMQVPALGKPMRPLANMLADALVPLLERRERETAALAWNEGHRAGIEHQRTEGQFIRFVETNPYRTDASTEETA